MEQLVQHEWDVQAFVALWPTHSLHFLCNIHKSTQSTKNRTVRGVDITGGGEHSNHNKLSSTQLA